MAHEACTELLQWALPQMGLRWQGFRRVRRQVCRRIEARRKSLGLPDLAAYRARLEGDEAEWQELDRLCRVTISRFCRNHRVFEDLSQVLAELAVRAAQNGRTELRIWSAGCASGEEPYSVSIVGGQLALRVVATDADPHMLERARIGRYQRGALKELTDEQREAAFRRDGELFVIADEHRARVQFLQQDVRQTAPPPPFDLVLCRNLAFTYFDQPTQQQVADRFARSLLEGGALVVGAHEVPPPPFIPWPGLDHIYRR